MGASRDTLAGCPVMDDGEAVVDRVVGEDGLIDRRRHGGADAEV